MSYSQLINRNIPICDFKDIIYTLSGNNDNVIQCVKEVFEEHCNEVEEMLDYIRYEDLEKQCRAIFDYVIDFIQYKEDEGTDQKVKTPARLIADREGDCKSMAIFIGSCLHCLGIPFCFRFVGFNERWKYYTHVYIVANPNQANQIVIDPVERFNDQPIFNWARPYSFKKDVNYR